MKKQKIGLKTNSIILIFLTVLLGTNACKEHTKKSPNSSAGTHLNTNVAKHRKDKNLVDSCKQFLQNGCIVLRTGNDVISSMFAQFNKQNKTYSHCGIAYLEDAKWYVYHSIGGEDNPNAILRRDSYETFVRASHNFGFGICKMDITKAEVDSIKKTVLHFYAQHVPFDMQFDLATTDKLYCAELIFKAFHLGLKQNNFFNTTKQGSFEFVSTDNIFINKHALMLCSIVY